jgi:hypothetical protein
LDKYNIILFKNNKKKKLIKKYKDKKKSLLSFNKMINKNKEIKFYKKFENSEECKFYLSLITDQEKVQKSLFLVDELGRNKPINLDSSEYVFIEISEYFIEEKIYDWSKKTKISYECLFKTYLNSTELKNIFTINNKLCIQINEDIKLFSLKNNFDSDRLLNLIELDFFENKRNDGIFSRDISTTHRKWIYNILKEKGFDIKRLYRLKTTFSKR